MNSLSWLLYWADVAQGLTDLLILTGLGLLSYVFFLTLAHWINAGESEPPKKPGTCLAVSLCLFLASSFVPSKDTIYMIAASEAGEAALKTPEFEKLRGVINKVLDDQLSPKEEK